MFFNQMTVCDKITPKEDTQDKSSHTNSPASAGSERKQDGLHLSAGSKKPRTAWKKGPLAIRSPMST